MLENIEYLSGGKFQSRGSWSHPRRIIDSYEVILVTDGEVFISSDGREYALKPDDVLVIEPDTLHFGTKESENVGFYWLHFKAEASLVTGHMHIENPYHLLLLFSQLLHFQSFNDGLFEANDYLTRLIIAELYRSRTAGGENALASRAAEWIRVNSDIPLKVSDVADKFGYNPDYLNRVFAKSYNKSVKAYIDDCKMQHIKSLLMTTDYSFKEIAEASGFSDYKFFLKFFKHREKMTPSEFKGIYFKTHLNNK